ncbi:uncharacterized protein (Precursor) [Nocardioides sp. PD653]|nr:uncharacterized protein (Precursor) [Nocardioides sp. PD653-B2]GAW54421.1 uncharacterized protein (Precursor) [Nocardioides sp. PD653]
MSYRRTAAAAAALIAVAAIAPQALPASAAPASGHATSAPRAGSALIQGVVVDQFGTYLDDVQVQATKADGTPSASALTYASDREDGPQHGYFFLEVTRGTYTLTVTRDGYTTLVLDDIEVAKARQKVSLGEIEIQKKLADTRTKGALEDSSITTKQNGVVDVEVSSKATSKPTGTVEVREGREVLGEGTLRTKNRGELTIGIDKLDKGIHHLKVYYLGSSTLKASSSDNLTLKVVRPKH